MTMMRMMRLAKKNDGDNDNLDGGLAFTVR